jgi:hypothetical protein
MRHLFDSFPRNDLTNPLLSDQDSLNSGHDQRDEKPKSKVDKNYYRIDCRLLAIQKKLLSRQFLLLRQLQAPENRQFRKYLCKNLGITGGIILSFISGGLFTLIHGIALNKRIKAAYKAFYIDIYSSLCNHSGVYGATCNDATLYIPTPYLCNLELPDQSPVYTPDYKKTITTLCEPVARILCYSDSQTSISIGITLIVIALVILAFLCLKLKADAESGSRPQLISDNETNILLSLPSVDKTFLMESGVIAPTTTEITSERLLSRIDQRRRQFTLFADRTLNLLPAISLIVAQYDEEVSLSCLPQAGDFSGGMYRQG